MPYRYRTEFEPGEVFFECWQPPSPGLKQVWDATLECGIANGLLLAAAILPHTDILRTGAAAAFALTPIALATAWQKYGEHKKMWHQTLRFDESLEDVLIIDTPGSTFSMHKARANIEQAVVFSRKSYDHEGKPGRKALMLQHGTASLCRDSFGDFLPEEEMDGIAEVLNGILSDYRARRALEKAAEETAKAEGPAPQPAP